MQPDPGSFRWTPASCDSSGKTPITSGSPKKTRRGAGVGRVFYGDVQSFAEVRVPCLAAEVFLEGSSHPALLFHGSFGFREIGQHVMNGPGVRAAMLVKELCSYSYVHQSYQGKLPDQPWLARRALPGREPQRATGS